MTDPIESGPTRPLMAGPTASDLAERDVFRQAGKYLAISLCALAVLGAVGGWLVAGLSGVWGALLGLIVVALFAVPTVWTAGRSVGLSPKLGAVLLGGSWAAKLVALIVILAALRSQEWFHRGTFFVVVLVGAMAAAAGLAAAVTKGRIPYVEAAAAKPLADSDPNSPGVSATRH